MTEVLKQINYVRLKKGVLLPCEVVGARGRLRTECFNDIEQPSPINWEFEKIISALINHAQKTIWNDFIKWMRLQQVETKWDFVAKWKWRITRDESIVVIDDGKCKTTYRRMDNNSFAFAVIYYYYGLISCYSPFLFNNEIPLRLYLL